MLYSSRSRSLHSKFIVVHNSITRIETQHVHREVSMQTDERRDWHVQRTLRFCFMNPERFVWVVSLLCVLMIRYCILAWSLYLCSSAAARRHLLMLASTLNRTFITNARIATSIIFTWDKIYSLSNPINWLQHGCLCIVRQVYHLLLTFFRENNTLISNEIKSLVILILIFLKKLILMIASS